MGTVYKDELDNYRILFSYLKKRFSEKEEIRECLVWQLTYYMVFMLMLKNLSVLQSEPKI